MSSVDPDEVIEEFLEGQPRADLWRDLRQTLAERLADAVAARDAVPEGEPGRIPLEKRVAELRDQVAALAQEEAVTRFVEDSVRASLNRPRRPGSGGGGDDGDAFDDDEAGYY
jgi:hypothetical protein